MALVSQAERSRNISRHQTRTAPSVAMSRIFRLTPIGCAAAATGPLSPSSPPTAISGASNGSSAAVSGADGGGAAAAVVLFPSLFPPPLSFSPPLPNALCASRVVRSIRSICSTTSSVSSILVAQRKQSASLSHMRIDMAEPQSGQPQATTSPLSQTSSFGRLVRVAAAGENDGVIDGSD